MVSPSPAMRLRVLATRTVFSSKSIPNTLRTCSLSCSGISAFVKSVPVSLKTVCTGNPQLPAAVSIIYSPGCGLSILTHISMTWRGVKYCPFSPLADLLTRYSNASSTTCRLELNNFISCKLETQTARWLSESSNAECSGKTPLH